MKVQSQVLQLQSIMSVFPVELHASTGEINLQSSSMCSIPLRNHAMEHSHGIGQDDPSYTLEPRGPHYRGSCPWHQGAVVSFYNRHLSQCMPLLVLGPLSVQGCWPQLESMLPNNIQVLQATCLLSTPPPPGLNSIEQCHSCGLQFFF